MNENTGEPIPSSPRPPQNVMIERDKMKLRDNLQNIHGELVDVANNKTMLADREKEDTIEELTALLNAKHMRLEELSDENTDA